MSEDLPIIEEYFSQLTQSIRQLPREGILQILEILRFARENNRTVFIFGNGGSASTASHMACDFGKNTRQNGRKRLQVISLADNMATFSAYANDEGYERVFAEPLKSLMKAGDVAIAISGSGNSENVLQGVQAARELGATIIGLTGFAGGKLKDLVDICLVVPANRMEQIEDCHLIIDHVLTLALRC